jgi:hypothetical protein
MCDAGTSMLLFLSTALAGRRARWSWVNTEFLDHESPEEGNSF